MAATVTTANATAAATTDTTGRVSFKSRTCCSSEAVRAASPSPRLRRPRPAAERGAPAPGPGLYRTAPPASSRGPHSWAPIYCAQSGSGRPAHRHRLPAQLAVRLAPRRRGHRARAADGAVRHQAGRAGRPCSRVTVQLFSIRKTVQPNSLILYSRTTFPVTSFLFMPAVGYCRAASRPARARGAPWALSPGPAFRCCACRPRTSRRPLVTPVHTPFAAPGPLITARLGSD
eukprot:COSAG05_NODE_3966_length_1745_cov_6.907655_2_plen_231_part_00